MSEVSRDWVLAGKSLLFVAGLTHLQLAFYDGPEPMGWLLRSWLTLCGAGCAGIVLHELRPSYPDGSPHRFTALEWARAGQGMLFCAGIGCVALALHRGGGLVEHMLRVWVGWLAAILVIFVASSARR